MKNKQLFNNVFEKYRSKSQITCQLGFCIETLNSEQTKKTADRRLLLIYWLAMSERSESNGAGGGLRTRTGLPPRDFESRASACSATPALNQ
jgi:hypothetical protein